MPWRDLPWACAGGSIFDMLTRDDRASWRAKASYILEGIHATIAITVVTFVALFMDDFRLAVLPPQLDVSCEYITGLIFVWPHPDLLLWQPQSSSSSGSVRCGRLQRQRRYSWPVRSDF